MSELAALEVHFEVTYPRNERLNTGSCSSFSLSSSSSNQRLFWNLEQNVTEEKIQGKR